MAPQTVLILILLSANVTRFRLVDIPVFGLEMPSNDEFRPSSQDFVAF